MPFELSMNGSALGRCCRASDAHSTGPLWRHCFRSQPTEDMNGLEGSPRESDQLLRSRGMLSS
eukprot:7001666-Alexandrium_andersonii.AAC.1